MRFIGLLILLCCQIAFAASDVYPFNSANDAARFSALTKGIRCVVCQNQSIADSNAPLANDLREKVYQMVMQKRSDADIKDYLVNRYGEFILLEPRFSWLTLVLWLFPVLAMFIITMILYPFFRQR